MSPIRYETWLTVKQTCAYLGVCARTLYEWRRDKYGPRWERRRGKILYSQAALDSYRQGAAA